MLIDGITIYAVDFDDTLTIGPWPTIRPKWSVINRVKRLQREEGIRTVLWTCRTGRDLDAAIEACKSWGLRFDTFNENIKEVREKFGEHGKKVSADYYLDDKALTISDFMKEETVWEKLVSGATRLFRANAKGTLSLYQRILTVLRT